MATFEERFAAVGRALDAALDRLRRGRTPRPYRAPRVASRRTSEWRERSAEKVQRIKEAAGDWRRGRESSGARRVNIAVILGAVVVTAGATWWWARGGSAGLTSQEVQALTKLSREPSKAEPAPAAGPWWNQATPPK